MEYNLEKSIKRYLKRKTKITLGFIVAFLLSCNFVSAEEFGMIIQQTENGILFNNKVFDKETHEFVGNTFENSIYANNNIIKLKNENDYVIGIAVGNMTDEDNIISEMEINSIKNNGVIDINGEDISAIYIDIYNNTSDFNISNTGIIKAVSLKDSIGIDNTLWEEKRIIGDIINNGVISVSGGQSSFGTVGIYNSNKFGDKMEINNVINKGIITAKNEIKGTAGVINSGSSMSIFELSSFINDGVILSSGYLGSSKGVCIDNVIMPNSYVINNGIILAENTQENATGLELMSTKSLGIKNTGLIGSYSKENGIYEREIYGIDLSYLRGDNELFNTGAVYSLKHSKSKSKVIGVNIYTANSGYDDTKNTTVSFINKGIILGEKNAVNKKIFDDNPFNLKFDNYGILANKTETENIIEIDNNNKDVDDIINNYGLMFTVKDDGTYKIDSTNQKTADNVINAKLTSDSKGTESISADNYIGKYINGITDTLKVEKDAEIKNSVINGYTNAVVFAEGGHSLTLKDTTVNGGLSNISDTENSLGTAISGSNSGEKLTLVSSSDENKTVINGSIDLGAGDDILTLNNKVQINGNINGGTDNDTLNFGSESLTASAKSLKDSQNILENSQNILYNISGFENINVNENITLFENIEVTDAKNITIGENGNLILRIDGTDNNSHALLGNEGEISSTGGKLLLALNGVGEGATIEFGDMILGESIKGNEIGYTEDITLDTTSLLHSLAKGENNTVTVKTVENLPETDIPENVNYDKLNKIYQSIRSVDKVGEFNVDGQDKLTGLVKYLHDIYAGNPYAYSSELSRKTMGMMRNLADKDLKPELNKWAVYGGFTHVDGGTENSYYGKGYYTYDIGSRDIEADTKITGGYFKAEYGKSQDITTGIIFGGNNSETKIGASKVEGDSFYFGAYAKKYLNNFRFILGAGFQHGDYKGERTAVGYEGIISTEKYDSNYHDRGFDIYGNMKYSHEIGNNFFFEPSFALSYTYLDQDGVKDEEGVLAAETDSQNFDYSSGEINLDLRKTFAGEKFTHSLTAGVSYERMLSGYDEEYITGRIKGGTDFDILVPEKEKDIFSLNAKYELETDKGILFDIKGSYRFEHDTDQNEWTVGTGIGYKF